MGILRPLSLRKLNICFARDQSCGLTPELHHSGVKTRKQVTNYAGSDLPFSYLLSPGTRMDVLYATNDYAVG